MINDVVVVTHILKMLEWRNEGVRLHKTHFVLASNFLFQNHFPIYCSGLVDALNKEFEIKRKLYHVSYGIWKISDLDNIVSNCLLSEFVSKMQQKLCIPNHTYSMLELFDKKLHSNEEIINKFIHAINDGGANFVELASLCMVMHYRKIKINMQSNNEKDGQTLNNVIHMFKEQLNSLRDPEIQKEFSMCPAYANDEHYSEKITKLLCERLSVLIQELESINKRVFNA